MVTPNCPKCGLPMRYRGPSAQKCVGRTITVVIPTKIFECPKDGEIVEQEY